MAINPVESYDIISIRLRDGDVVQARVAGNGPPLIMLGNMVAWPFWSYQVPALAQQYRVIAPQYRSRHIPGMSALDSLAADVPDLIHALGYDRVLLMGHSIGAMVLARVLELTPEVADAVVLANGFLHLWLKPAFLRPLQPGLVPLLRAIYPRLPWFTRQLAAYGFLWIGQHVFLHREPDREKRKMFFGYSFTPDGAMIHAVGSALEYNRAPDLRHAAVPVLIVSGGRDPWVPITEAHQLAEMLPCGEHVILPSVGHMLPMIAPDAFNQTVLEFFGRVRRGVL